MAKRREGGFLISKVKQLSARIFDKKLKNYGISELNSAQGRIIFSLWQKDKIAISALARETALGKTTLTSMLNRLEKSGLIVKQASTADRRRTIVSLTEKSKRLQDKFERFSEEMTDLFYRGLAEAEIDQFEKTLAHILTNLTNEEENYDEG